jgi:hypothetical protein
MDVDAFGVMVPITVPIAKHSVNFLMEFWNIMRQLANQINVLRILRKEGNKNRIMGLSHTDASIVTWCNYVLHFW